MQSTVSTEVGSGIERRGREGGVFPAATAAWSLPAIIIKLSTPKVSISETPLFQLNLIRVRRGHPVVRIVYSMVW